MPYDKKQGIYVTPTNEEIFKKIEAFLDEPRSSNGGYAKITDQDVVDLKDIINMLIDAKCETDPDGDLPLQVKVVNLTTHQSTHFMALPHHHDTEKSKDLKDVLSIASMNASIAVDQVTKTVRLMELLDRFEKEDEEKKKK